MATRTNEPFSCNKWDPKSPWGRYSSNTWQGQFVNACMQREHTHTDTHTDVSADRTSSPVVKRTILSIFTPVFSLSEMCCNLSRGPGSVESRSLLLKISEVLHRQKRPCVQTDKRAVVIITSMICSACFFRQKTDSKLNKFKLLFSVNVVTKGNKVIHLWNHSSADGTYSIHFFNM